VTAAPSLHLCWFFEEVSVRRRIALSFSIVLVITACGGSSAEENLGDGAGGDGTSPPTDEDTSPENAPASGNDGSVVVVIGDKTYEMGLVEGGFGVCTSMTDGSVTINAGTSDLDFTDPAAPAGASIYAVIQTNDWQPGSSNEPYVAVTDYDNGENWTAGGARAFGYEEHSAVLESSLGDGQASVTALFIEEGQAIGSQEEPVSYEGTVDVDCGS
jgi:hypothetical protein